MKSPQNVTYLILPSAFEEQWMIIILGRSWNHFIYIWEVCKSEIKSFGLLNHQAQKIYVNNDRFYNMGGKTVSQKMWSSFHTHPENILFF